MFWVLVKKAVWTQDEKSAEYNTARQAYFRQAYPIDISFQSAQPQINLLVATGKNRFKPQFQTLQRQWNSSACAECPFYFRQKQNAVEVHFDSQFEGSTWRPARFTRKQKHKQNTPDNTIEWHRHSRLFSLEEQQSAVFKINYFHGNRTIAGASMTPAYQQFEGYFVNSPTLTPLLFEREYTFERDELLILR